MDADKVNEEAWDYHSDNYFADNPHREDIMGAFCKGAYWFMQQPLSDRLTDEEKERIKAIYFRNVYSVADVQSNFTEKCLIDAIFGKEIFK